MSPPDLKPIVDQMTASVRGFTERAVAPLREKVAALESGLAALPSTDFVRAEVAGACSRQTLDLLAAVSKSQDGKSLSIADVTPMVEKLVGAIPVPKDGTNGRDGKDGLDGASVDPAAVREMVAAAVTDETKDLPPMIKQVTEHAVRDEVKALADAIALRFTAAAIA